jgi:DNA-binding NtrC family response regulator
MKRKGKRILVVDDDDTIRDSFKAILESEGHKVDTAKSGLEALERTEEDVYNLALLDIKLPDIEGTELLVEMHEETPRMMKIMVTGHATLENAVEALNLGADAFIMKPVKPKELLRVVEEKLKEQEDAEKMSEEKVAEWIEERVRKLEASR